MQLCSSRVKSDKCCYQDISEESIGPVRDRSGTALFTIGYNVNDMGVTAGFNANKKWMLTDPVIVPRQYLAATYFRFFFGLCHS